MGHSHNGVFIAFCCIIDKLCQFLLWLHGQHPAMLLCLWDFPARITGVGCHFLLQGVFLTQELNPRILHAGGFFTTEPSGKLLLEHCTAIVSQVVLAAQSREGAPQASGQEGGRGRWKAKAPALCRGGEVVGAQMGAESIQYLGLAALPWLSVFFLCHAQTLWPLSHSPTPVWLFHLLDVAVLWSIVRCPCPSPVLHVCAPTEVYAPCPSPH